MHYTFHDLALPIYETMKDDPDASRSLVHIEMIVESILKGSKPYTHSEQFVYDWLKDSKMLPVSESTQDYPSGKNRNKKG